MRGKPFWRWSLKGTWWGNAKKRRKLPDATTCQGFFARGAAPPTAGRPLRPSPQLPGVPRLAPAGWRTCQILIAASAHWEPFQDRFLSKSGFQRARGAMFFEAVITSAPCSACAWAWRLPRPGASSCRPRIPGSYRRRTPTGCRPRRPGCAWRYGRGTSGRG